MKNRVMVGIVKIGNLGITSMLDPMLDERAERQDLDIRVTSSGPKLTEECSKEVAERILEFNPDLVVIVGPNPTLPGPSEARKIIAESGKPCVIIGDAPGAKLADKLEKEGIGYIFIEADSMIGARREFLDPTEMSLFNADLIKVLSVTGAFRLVKEEIDKAIEGVKSGSPYLPRVIVNRDKAVDASGFSNPYARAKAMAAFEISKRVAAVSTQGCFKVHEMEKYIPIVTQAHEMMRVAAKLADEARELEKSEDAVLRKPHADDGKLLTKRKLMEKPR